MVPRRRLLRRAGLATASALTLAGCTDRSGSGTPTHATTGSPSAPPTRRPTGSPTDVPTPAGPARYTRRASGADGVALVATDSGAYHVSAETARALGDGGEVRWTTDGPGEDPSGAAVVDGTLFVASPGTLRAHRTDDGTVRWDADGATGPPCVAGGAVVATDAERLVARAPDDGAERWRVAVDGTPTGTVGFGDGVAVATRGPGEEARVTAVDAADGSRRWQHHPGYRVTTRPVASDGRVLVGVLNPGHEASASSPTPSAEDGTANGGVVAVEAGTDAWTATLPGRPTGLTAADGVVVTHDAFVFESLVREPHVSALDGDAAAWSRQPVPAGGPPVLTRGVVGLSGEARTTALLRDSGRTRWERSGSVPRLAAAGERLLAGTADGVRALDPVSGAERWHRGG